MVLLKATSAPIAPAASEAISTNGFAAPATFRAICEAVAASVMVLNDFSAETAAETAFPILITVLNVMSAATIAAITSRISHATLIALPIKSTAPLSADIRVGRCRAAKSEILAAMSAAISMSGGSSSDIISVSGSMRSSNDSTSGSAASNSTGTTSSAILPSLSMTSETTGISSSPSGCINSSTCLFSPPSASESEL